MDAHNYYDPIAYKNPFVVGFETARTGAIIPVNAQPDLAAAQNQIEVWWYRRSEPPTTRIKPTYWPSYVQKYTLAWPGAAHPDEIVMARNAGSDTRVVDVFCAWAEPKRGFFQLSAE